MRVWLCECGRVRVWSCEIRLCVDGLLVDFMLVKECLGPDACFKSVSCPVRERVWSCGRVRV